MAKKINEKIVNTHQFTVEGILNVDGLEEGSIIAEVEEVGEVDLKGYIDKFNGKNIKLSITEKVEEIPED